MKSTVKQTMHIGVVSWNVWSQALWAKVTGLRERAMFSLDPSLWRGIPLCDDCKFTCIHSVVLQISAWNQC